MTAQAKAIARMFESVSLGAPENAIGFVMWRLVHRYQRELDVELAALDLTHLQFQVLTLAAWLGRTGQPARQSELSTFGDVQPMQVSYMLRSLEEKGLVTRARDDADIRAKCVRVTTPGLKALRQALPLAIEVQQRIFGEDGRPGGSLLAALLALEAAPAK